MRKNNYNVYYYINKSDEHEILLMLCNMDYLVINVSNGLYSIRFIESDEKNKVHLHSADIFELILDFDDLTDTSDYHTNIFN